MKLTPVTRTLVESGVVISLITGGAWLAVLAYKVDANAAATSKLEDEQKVLAKDLVDTQKAIIEDVTEIKTILKQRR